MAIIYDARLVPSKIEILQEWVPLQPWIGGADTAVLEAVGAYRFDDPGGEVGIETHLLRTGDGHILQVPLTYRGAPRAGAESSLVTTMHHSILGQRWVYDACGDDAYAHALAVTMLNGGAQAELEVVTNDGTELREPSVRVSGSGSLGGTVVSGGMPSYTNEDTTTVIGMDGLELIVVRVLGDGFTAGSRVGTPILTGTWPGRDEPALLASVRAD